MIRQYELIEKIQAYNPKADVALLNRAYVYSMKAHGNQKRASGQPYLVHPLEVSSILADLQLDDATIAVGLLHDTLEDTLSTYEEIKQLFGEEIAQLTEGVTKLSRVAFHDKAVEQAENFRKLLLAMSQDIRVLLVKLADRVHNMRTLEHIPKPEKRARIAQETLDIYAPLADRIGLHKVKLELEDIAFHTLEPEEYARLEKKMAEWRAQENLVGRTIEELENDLHTAGAGASVTGREKAVYSIYRKMKRKSLTFEQLTDIIAYRVVVDDKRMCYEVLGLMHDIYKAVPGRFKDYISAPKPNGYQSLHTSVIGPFGNRMEVQIRTHDMHEVAEAGVAAHFTYKEGKKQASITENTQYKWIRQLVEQLQGMDDPQEFYENAKVELFADNVFVFTPKGDLINLPKGATPLDFAYAIHSDVGDHCQAARVNGIAVPLRRELNNGDIVSITTNKAQTPSPGWTEFVASSRAKTAINRYLRGQERDMQLRNGRDILATAAKRDGYTVKEKELTRIVKDLPIELKNNEDVYAALGQGRLFPRQVFDILFAADKAAEAAQAQAEKADTFAVGKAQSDKIEEGQNSEIGIEGLMDGMSVHFSKCCSPLPGEKIVGIISTGRGISIHVKDCRNLEQFSDQPDRFMPVKWSEEAIKGTSRLYVCRIRFILVNEPGTLSTLSTAIFNADANVINIFTEHRASDTLTLRCEMEVYNKDHLNQLISQIGAQKTVIAIEKIFG